MWVRGLAIQKHAELNGMLVKLTLAFNTVKICSNMITVITADLLCHSIISQHVTALLRSEMWEVDESEMKSNTERQREHGIRRCEDRKAIGIRRLL